MRYPHSNRVDLREGEIYSIDGLDRAERALHILQADYTSSTRWLELDPRFSRLPPYPPPRLHPHSATPSYFLLHAREPSNSLCIEPLRKSTAYNRVKN